MATHKRTQAQVDAENAFWRKQGVEINFEKGDSIKRRREKRDAAIAKYQADKKKKDQLKRKKKNLAARKRREELRAKGLTVQKTAGQKLEDNLVRLLRKEMPNASLYRDAAREILRVYKLTKK